MTDEICDSCGKTVGKTVSMYHPTLRYDHGWAHGIGPCCVPRFQEAGYSVCAVPKDRAEWEAIQELFE